MKENTLHLPLHRLFVQLQTNGLYIGAAERLRIQQILVDGGAWMNEEGRAALKYEIAPLICRNNQEQEVFYKLYEDFLDGLSEALPSIVTPPKAVNWFQKHKRALYWAGLLLVILSGIWLLPLIIPQKEAPKAQISVSFQEKHSSKPVNHPESRYPLLEVKPGERIDFENTSESFDSQQVQFKWEIRNGGVLQNDPNGGKLEQLDSSFHFQYKAKPSSKDKSQFFKLITLHAYDKQTKQKLGEAQQAKAIAISCPNKPEVQDSIQVIGNSSVGGKLKFQAPKELKPQWKKEWSISDGTGFEKIAKPEHSFQKAGNYTLLLAISDTTQEGYCTTFLSKVINIVEEIPILEPLELYKDEQESYWAFSNWAKTVGMVLLLISLWFLWRWWRRPGITVPVPRPQVSAALSNAFEPKERQPFTIPYRSNNHYIQQATEQITLANTLRRRQSGEQTSLDISKSIHATIAKMGYAELHFNTNTRPAHYLFLLDLQSEVSHQAQLFSYLVGILLEQEVLADVFFYKNDFSHFWNKLYPEGLSLELLAMRYGDRRLVIFGDGDRLISENIGGGWHHPEWVDSLKRWPQRMLITPVPVVSWTLRETRLYKVFPVFQADLGGLMQAARFVESGMQEENLPLTFAEWQNQCLNSLIDADTERLWRSPADHRAYLAEANGEEMLYRWLRALVVYPELNWNITIAIGRSLGVDVSFEHLLTLARIPWLNEGNMKLSLWRAWWKELPKEDERIAREAVKLELEAVAEQSALGFADQKLQIRLAVQQFALTPDADAAQDAIRFILDNIEPSAQLDEELDLVMTRHITGFKKGDVEPSGTIKHFLKQEPEVVRPLFTVDLWVSIASVTCFLIPILIGPLKIGGFLNDWGGLVVQKTKDEDQDFKILVLPFKQVCASSGKNYDVGYVLTRRFVEIARKENLNIKVNYWSDYHFEGYFSYQTAKELQEYHRVDMLIYGAYQTSDCSADGDQICLNYVTAEKWKLGKAGANFSPDYQPGGYDDLKKGKIQEKVENIAVLISILTQIKSLDRAEYLKKLQRFLNEPDFSSDAILGVYLELADKLIEEGKLKEPLIQYKKVLQIAIDQDNKEYQVISLKRIGDTYSTSGNLKQALVFFEKYNALAKELLQAFPQNAEFKNELAISYRKLGSMHSDLGNLNEALTFFGKYNDLEKELYQAFPKNVEFKNALAVSYDKLGVTHSTLGNLPEALKFFKKYNDLEKELNQASPQNVEFKNELGVSYERLGNTHSALGHLKQALAFFEQYNRLGKELYAAHPENVYVKNHLAISYSKLGETQSALGNLPQALRFFAKSIDLERKLNQDFPQNVYFKNHLAISYSKLGETHRALGNLPEALNFFEKYNDLAKELYKAFPQNVEFKNALANSYQFLGITHSDLDSLPQALAFFKKYNDVEKELYATNPENVESKSALAISYNKLGEMYRSLGNLSKALAFFEKDVELTKELFDASPQNVEFKNNLAISYEKLGDIYSELDSLPQALAFFGNETRLFEELSQAFPNDMAFKNALVFAYARLGKTHIALGNLTQALTFFKKYYAIAKELYQAFPQDEFNKSNYAESLSVLFAIQKLLSPSIGTKDLDKAIQLFKELNKIEPEYFKKKTAICYKMKQTNADLKQLILEMSAF